MKKQTLIIVGCILAAAVLFGGLGYWAGHRKTVTTAVIPTPPVPPVPTLSATPTSSAAASTTTSTVADWKTYTNDKYGFTLTFDDLWSGYTVKEETPTPPVAGANAEIKFYLPTQDWAGTANNPWNPFILSIYTPSAWATESAQEGPIPTFVVQNDSYVIAYSTAQDRPNDGVSQINDVKNVVATLKFTK
jgi:hypothetical protein